MPPAKVLSKRTRAVATAEAAPPVSSVGGVTAHSSGLAIIASKISPAIPGRSVLTRRRLVEWFGQQADARLILVSAEAGYGKSTLLNDFSVRTTDRCVWFRLERSDGDWITFLSHMVAAFREISPGFGRSTEALLRNVAAMGPSAEVVLAQFLAELGALDLGRVAVILDDYHLVERSDDVRMILARMLERAPEGMYVVLGGRGRPNLAVGRLMGQGRVAELTVDDLRFTLPEIKELFSSAYGQPLDDEAYRIVAERTEGWAAGLRLVSASIAASRPGEVGAFIEALSGASGPIYDFLGEEILTRLSATTKRVLMHASLIDRIRPDLVAAALSVTADAPDVDGVHTALAEADALGLLGDRSRGTGARRMHPLFREFLLAHLERETSTERIRAIHRAIAVEAQVGDWLVAARHFALAAEPGSSMMVLGSAASAALGTGAWGQAVEIVAMLPDTEPPAAVKVIQARALIGDGFTQEALDLLGDIDRAGLAPEDHGLVGLTLAAIHHMNGEGEQVREEIERIAGDHDIPSPLREVAASWRQLLLASGGGCITDAVRMLRRLAVDQRNAGLHYFAGVTIHNMAYGELARGRYKAARSLAHEALQRLAVTDAAESISSSTRSISAAATAELGDLEEGLRLANVVASLPGATADAIADSAYLNAVCGRTDKAGLLIAQFDRGDAPWSQELGSRAQGCFARIAVQIAQGQLGAAEASLQDLRRLEGAGIDTAAREAMVTALLAVLGRRPEAPRLTQMAVQTAADQNAWRWLARSRILKSVADRDGQSLAMWLADSERESALAVLELADAIAAAVSTLAPMPQALERSILREPSRWMPALGRQIQNERTDDAGAAATLVARFGTADDAELLRRYDRSPNGKHKRRGLATRLIRRVSPTIRVHDLGLTNIDIGSRVVTLTETRRKPAALMLYLVTRLDWAAARDQVMDSLWPDQSPKSALNSLHQTLFYLRRELEPWYEDGSTADYIRMESDLVFLDQAMFQIDSAAFSRQASDILATGTALRRGREMLSLYRGSFAPEFEYEPWAEEYRTRVHGIFLHLAHATSTALLREGQYSEVIEVLTPIIALDPHALELRAKLVGCLSKIGARDAALAHYRSLARAYDRDLGLRAPSFEELLQDFDTMA